MLAAECMLLVCNRSQFHQLNCGRYLGVRGQKGFKRQEDIKLGQEA